MKDAARQINGGIRVVSADNSWQFIKGVVVPLAKKGSLARWRPRWCGGDYHRSGQDHSEGR
uniref:Uncharacterized protein n=1 Tax=Arundo donax TaxID=35708 RepID=A0A0A8Z7H6_ARUDO